MADKSTNKISLKALVNERHNKVIFIESDHDFVDVLFSFLTIPVGTIIRLSHRRSLPLGIGCIKNLYESVESIDLKLFRTKECRAMLLCPRNAAESFSKNLELNIGDCEPAQYYKCSNWNCPRKSLSYYNSVRCRCGHLTDLETYVSTSGGEGVFVEGPNRFIISDDLQVMPPITSASSSLVKKLGFKGWNTIKEVTFSVGVNEVLNLVMFSLVSRTPLTDILLKHKQVTKLRTKVGFKPIYLNSQFVGKMNNDEADISLKLIISKSKKMVCYAEAGEDFVDLLFSFLTIPLGFVLKNMEAGSLRGCTDHLYKSVEDLDEQYLKSKEMLLSPKLLPGFCYENNPLGLKEASYHDVLGPLISQSAQIIDPKSRYMEDGSAHGFLKGPAMFLVTDSLKISPISAIRGMSILCDLGVPVTDIEVRVAQVSKDEALRLLVASFAFDSALTNVFLGSDDYVSY